MSIWPQRSHLEEIISFTILFKHSVFEESFESKSCLFSQFNRKINAKFFKGGFQNNDCIQNVKKISVRCF